MFPDSDIAKKYGAKRTKTTAMVWGIWTTVCHRCELCGGNYFGLMVDETTDRYVDKQLVTLARVFVGNKVSTKFLDMPICNLSTAADLFTAIDNVLRVKEISWSKVIAFNSDNCSVMKSHRNGLIAKIRAVNPNIVDVGCVCHMENLTVGKALKRSLFNLDELICDLSTHFSCSTKRLESLKEFQDFVGVEQQNLIKHCPTRWLSLRRCNERLIIQLPALKSYFGAQPEVDTKRSKVYQIFQILKDPLLLPWLHFMNVFLEPFYKFNMTFQGEDVLITDMYSGMERLIRRVLSFFIEDASVKSASNNLLDAQYNRTVQLSDLELFVGTEARKEFIAVEEDLRDGKAAQFITTVRDVMAASVDKMLQLFPFASKILKLVPAAHINNREHYSASDILWLAKDTGIFMKAGDLDALHQKWIDLQLEEIPEQDRYTSPACFWDVKAFELYPKTTSLMRALLSIPHSNASSERVFSMLKKIHTEQRADLCLDSINSLLSVKLNIDTCCYDSLLSNSMLKKLKKASTIYNEKHLHTSTTGPNTEIIDLSEEDE